MTAPAISSDPPPAVSVRSPPLQVADLLHCGLGQLLPHAKILRDPQALHRGARLLLVGGAKDERLGWFHARARELGNASLVLWTAGRSIAVVVDDGRSQPCAGCALLFDRAFAGVGLWARQATEATGGDLKRRVAEMAAQMSARGEDLPSPGQALVFEDERSPAVHEPYLAHPSCPCAARGGARTRAAPTLDTGAAWAGRFAPVAGVPMRGDGLARVLFRKSRSPWPLTGRELGVATAAGPKAEERALAEAVERFCMLHAPPDRTATPARDLHERVLPAESIRSLLYREEERAASGFRLADYDEAAAHDWSWLEECRTGRRVLAPTTLIGRPSPTATRLVDATSNGYAAHRDPGQALRHALLEVIERDAVLLTWHLGLQTQKLELPRPAAFPAAVEVHAFLVTQDIHVPVVLFLAVREDGSLRCAGGAGTSFDEAWERATLEMQAACATPLLVLAPGAPAPGTDDAGCAFGPEDHFRYYQHTGRARAAIAAIQARAASPRGRLRARWPDRRVGLATLLDALAQAGLDAWFTRRSLPAVFGAWHVVRALVPGAVELSWGQPYRRLASPRVLRHLRAGRTLSPLPHPIA